MNYFDSCCLRNSQLKLITRRMPTNGFNIWKIPKHGERLAQYVGYPIQKIWIWINWLKRTTPQMLKHLSAHRFMLEVSSPELDKDWGQISWLCRDNSWVEQTRKSLHFIKDPAGEQQIFQLSSHFPSLLSSLLSVVSCTSTSPSLIWNTLVH